MLNSSLLTMMTVASGGDEHSESVVSAIPQAARPEDMTWAGLMESLRMT